MNSNCKYLIKTLGCKTNHYESKRISESLRCTGIEKTSNWKEADIIIINTCAVTHIAERKSRQFIRRAKKENPNVAIYVTGCSIKSDNKKIKELIKEEFIISDKNTLPEIIIKNHSFSRSKTHALSKSRVREYLMIEDGCENFCSYCIIPHLRGPIRSIPFNEVINEANKLIAKGAKEIILTGINVGRYKDGNNSLEKICKEILRTGIRLRLSSIEPDLISDELLNTIKTHTNFCKHLHIPLQGGSDKILSDMNRKYSTNFYFNLISKIRTVIQNISISTDLIVGFPSENETTFNETLLFLEKCDFAKIHIFPYSIRKGTPASLIQREFDDSQLKQWQKRISEQEALMRNAYYEKHINQDLDILIEEQKQNYFLGYSSNYLRVEIYSADNLMAKSITTKLPYYNGSSLTNTPPNKYV